MGSETQDKIKKRLMIRRRIFLVWLLVIFLVILLSIYLPFDTGFGRKLIRYEDLLLDFHKPVFVRLDTISESEHFSDYSDHPDVPLNLSSFDNCSFHDIFPRPRDIWETKPLFLPMIPHTLSDAIHKKLINHLTQLPSGGKSFYASIRNELKHCKGHTETATCTVHHPSVKMRKGQPDSFSHFHDNYIYFMRNPMFLFPATLNAKDNLYRGIEGQTKRENWIQFRDKYLYDFLQEWKQSLDTWFKSRYNLALYLTYEDLMHVHRGPQALQRLGGVLKDAGFNVTEDEYTLKCIWYNSVGREQIIRHHKIHYDYDDYIPTYKVAQRELILKELDNFMDEHSDDNELIRILHRYVSDISLHMKVDSDI